MKRKELELIIDSIIEESFHIQDQEQAFAYLTKIATTQGSTTEKEETYIHSVLQKEFLPHIGIDELSYPKKIRFITYMIQKLLMCYYNQRDFDDHDHSKNKRCDVSGVLLGNIFKQALAKQDRDLRTIVKRKMENGNNLQNINLNQLINNLSITKDLTYVIKTGNWGVQKNSRTAKTGVSQVLNRFNFQATLSHSRSRINPMPKNTVMSQPRQLHNTIWGTSCPSETPEGHSIGLVTNQALSHHISIGFSSTFIAELLQEKVCEEKNSDTLFIVFLNGKIMGYYRDDKIYYYIRSLKLNNMLPIDTGIYCNYTNLRSTYFYR